MLTEPGPTDVIGESQPTTESVWMEVSRQVWEWEAYFKQLDFL